MDTSRQRVLKRTPARPRATTPRPSPTAVAAAYVDIARERVSVGVEELESAVAARLGIDVEDDLLHEVAEELLYDGPVALLASDVVVHVPTLMAGAVLTHRLTDEERAEDFLLLDTDLAGFRRVAEPVVGEDPLGVDAVDDDTVAWTGPEGWLAGLPESALIAVSVDAAGVVDVRVLDETPPTPPGLAARLRAVYDAELAEPGLPVPAEALVLGLRHHDRDVFADAAPPLDELAAAAGLERRGDEFGHAESVWAAAAEADRHWRLLGRLGPGGSATTALEVLDLVEDGAADATALRRALDLAQEPDVVTAVTEELLGELDDPEALAAFVGLADRMVAVAGRSPRAAVARWMAAVAAERDGRVLDAESHLRAACSEAEGWPFVEDRLAWFEADRGDAAAALMRWRSIGVEEGDEDLSMALRFAGTAAPAPGRNEPCPCGSGRKVKQCHLGRPVAAPLNERVGWLWRKAVAYLERRGGAAEAAMEWSAGARAVEDGDVDAAYGDPLTADVTLHEEGWFARFLRERGPLLPEDEALLGASWLLVDRTVHEVLTVDPGAGMELRDLRTGDRVAVTERTASRTVTAGMLLCARAVPDGIGHQFVGGVLAVPPGGERGLLALLDEGSGVMLLEWAAAGRRHLT